MSCVLDRLEVSTRVLKRAQYEAFDFRLTDDGVVVRNGSHANPDDHVYTVTIADGLPSACTCPADEHYEVACKHRLAVAIREPVLDAAVVHTATDRVDGRSRGDRDEDEDQDQNEDEDEDEDEGPGDGPGAPPVVVADGTGPATDDPERPVDCTCPDGPEPFPCWPCVRDGYRDLPSRGDETPADPAANDD